MKTLFPDELEPGEPPRIPGLTYRQNYITEAEEQELVSAVDTETWDMSWQRRRQIYGSSYGHSELAVRPIPAWGLSLAKRLYGDGIGDRPFDHMLVNEYLPGQGIALHRDYEPYDRTVVSLSLLSDCVMDFRRVGEPQRKSLLLNRRSLLILCDDARYKWQHGIARRKNDHWHGHIIPRTRRLSITFRSRREREVLG